MFDGWCLDSNGNDNGEQGQIKLGGEYATPEDCLEDCKKHKDATGCEYSKPWGCQYQTLDVKSGTGDAEGSKNVHCWVPKGK